MKSLKTASIIMVIIILISCSKRDTHTVTTVNGVNIHNNTNTPAKPDLKYNLTEVFTISNDTTGIDTMAVIKAPFDIDVDKYDNIYILDAATSSIKKYDSSGTFLKSFGRKGEGPGEFDVSIDFTIIDDTLNVQAITSAQMVRFDLEGNFIDRIPYVGTPGIFLEESIKSPASGVVIGYKSNVKEENGGILMGTSLLLMDNRFNEIKILREFMYKYYPAKTQFFEELTKYSYGEGKIFVAENSESQFKINVYDYHGRVIEVINKNYIKVSYNEIELGIIEKINLVGAGGEKLKQKQSYKKSVNNMFYDKYGCLLVCPSIERNDSNDDQFIADVFQDGVFLNRIVIKELVQLDFNVPLNGIVTYFFKDRIYKLNQPESSLAVYSYTVEGL